MAEEYDEEKEEEIYDEESREELVEGGEISAEEAGFMQGYEDAEEKEDEDKKEDEDSDEEEEKY